MFLKYSTYSYLKNEKRMEDTIMTDLNNFIDILSGEFDNAEQIKLLNEKGIHDYPFAKHINTVCNNKISGIPKDFKGIFMLEESYYTMNGHTNAMPHLFLFTEEEDSIKLTSYELPSGYDKTNFTYQNLEKIQFSDLKVSEKFTPAIYKKNHGVWEGGSESMFTPVLKFKLYEKFSQEQLEVSETMEMNGKRTFGFDEPIIYKRKESSQVQS